MSDWVPVGKLLGPYGIKGWIKIYSYTQPLENIQQYSPLWVDRDGNQQPIELTTVQKHGKGLIGKVAGCDSREEVPKYTGLTLSVQRSQLPSLESGDFYWSDLEGLAVENLAGERLGTVSYLLETGANDVLVVGPCEGSLDDTERLIPYLWQDVVHKVDLPSQKILVDWDSDF